MVKVFPVIVGELDENFTQKTNMDPLISKSDIQISEEDINLHEYTSRVWYIKAKVFSRVRLYQTNDNYRIQITEEWGDANPH